jgi:hypothetical protein
VRRQKGKPGLATDSKGAKKALNRGLTIILMRWHRSCVFKARIRLLQVKVEKEKLRRETETGKEKLKEI